ncbi:MAG: hypothetical protein MUF05_02975 [Candidatus Omnitrophica bacterium]|jgi:FkbM family methyltransferase|nr:hypothetical protein [Candidatus Omnitrophota bacterium]
MQHHDIFRKFKPYSGYGRKGYAVNFLGVFTDVSHICPIGPELQKRHNVETDERIWLETQYPDFQEEYFEWISLLESVVQAKQDFTAIELGAGIAPHLINAAAAIKKYHGDSFVFKLIGVEGEPTSYKWMRKHFIDNGINPDDHTLIEAVVSRKDGYAIFEVGFPQGYGSYIVTSWQLLLRPLKETYRFIKRSYKRIKGQPCDAKDYWTGKKGLGLYTKKIRCIGLDKILAGLKKVDLIHLDIKGEEYRVLSAVKEQLSEKVKRIHIGTHSHDVESRLRKLFKSMGWECIFDFPGNDKRITPFGQIKFLDGVQYWRNTKVY